MKLEKIRGEEMEKLISNGDSLSLLKTAGNQDRASFAFKCFIIVQMIFIWTGYTLTIKYTRSNTPEYLRYSSTTVVFLSEVIKLIISLYCLFIISNFKVREFTRCIKEEYFGKPMDLLKMSVPSIAYALQNNLDFVALSNLDAGIYQVTTQLKVVTTAFFMMIILGRRFSTVRWLAIFLLFCGVAAVQMMSVLVTPAIICDRGKINKTAAEQSIKLSVSEGSTVKKNGENYFLGLGAVLLTCATAGFAGVYFEWMLKDGSKTPFWIRNLQMYSCGVVSAGVGCFLSEWDKIIIKGFFYGYDNTVIIIVFFLSLGGIFISLVMKYLDNLYKSFASAVSIILVVIFSYILFQDIQLNLIFVAGSMTVCGAIMLYNFVSE